MGTRVTEGRGGSVPHAAAEISLKLVLMTKVRQAVTLQPMEVHGRANTHLQLLEKPVAEQVEAQRRL